MQQTCQLINAKGNVKLFLMESEIRSIRFMENMQSLPHVFLLCPTLSSKDIL